MPAVILNVDDHGPARYARGRILSGAGYKVHDAGTGGEAIRRVLEHRPDLVLLDMHLPDSFGTDVCREMKRISEEPLMVVQITASALTPSHATAALDAGADAYIMEPIDPDVLVATVRAMLRLHDAERSLAHANRQLEIVNRELQRSNEDLQQFAFAASHDLQEPLRAITAYTQILGESMKEKLSESERGYLNNVVAGAGRMKLLIRDLLAYSQVGRENRVHDTVCLTKAFKWALANLAEQIEQTGTRIVVPPDPPSVVGDFAHLGLVFQNLFSNAIKYRKPDVPAVVNVRIEKASPSELLVRVEDNGIGVAPEYFDQIFAPFKRLHGLDIPGTGIGLALCRRIVTAHGGRLWVESVPGEGTTLCLTLRAA